MADFIEYDVDLGGAETAKLRVEISEPVALEAPPAGRGDASGDTVLSAARGKFEEALDPIVALGKAAKARVDQVRPDKSELTFGLKFTGEAGAFIAKTGAEAQLQVKLTWEKPSS